MQEGVHNTLALRIQLQIISYTKIRLRLLVHHGSSSPCTDGAVNQCHR